MTPCCIDQTVYQSIPCYPPIYQLCICLSLFIYLSNYLSWQLNIIYLHIFFQISLFGVSSLSSRVFNLWFNRPWISANFSGLSIKQYVRLNLISSILSNLRNNWFVNQTNKQTVQKVGIPLTISPDQCKHRVRKEHREKYSKHFLNLNGLCNIYAIHFFKSWSEPHSGKILTKKAVVLDSVINFWPENVLSFFYRWVHYLCILSFGFFEIVNK